MVKKNILLLPPIDLGLKITICLFDEKMKTIKNFNSSYVGRGNGTVGVQALAPILLLQFISSVGASILNVIRRMTYGKQTDSPLIKW